MKKNNLKLLNEDKLLLCCARIKIDSDIKEKVVSLIGDDFDWQHLIEMATRHKLRPLLYHNLNSICPEKVPEDILQELKTYFNANVRKNLMFTGELVKILELLKNENIGAIPYKGPFLAALAYNNVGLRQYNDLDVFIDQSDILRAKKALILEGYEPYFNLNNIDDSQLLRTQREYLFKSNKGFIVELHWNIQGPNLSFPMEPKCFYKELKLIKINNFESRSFNTENLILILCLHAAKHDWNQISFLIDIALLIQSKNINWVEVLEKADKLCIKRILSINILLIYDLFNLKNLNEVLNDLKFDSTSLKISNQIKELLFNEKSLNMYDKFVIDLKKRENIKFGIKDCVFDLTKPSYADFDDLSLPKSLFNLYLVIRPFLLIKRYINNLFEHIS